MSKISVDVSITSDIACPWCWIGKKYLDAAMQQLENDFQFNIRWKPFLLNSSLPEEGVPWVDYCKHKFGEEAAKRFLSGSSPISTHARSLGITFNQNRMVVPTKKSHILTEYASRHGKQHELQEVLFRAYFSDGRNVNSDTVLKELAVEAGLDPAEAVAALSDSKYIQEFEEGIKEARQKGISGVPSFDISLTSLPAVCQTFSGAQPVDTFVSVFSRLKSTAKI